MAATATAAATAAAATPIAIGASNDYARFPSCCRVLAASACWRRARVGGERVLAASMFVELVFIDFMPRARTLAM